MAKKITCGCGFLIALFIVCAAFILWRLSIPPKKLDSSVPTSPQQRAEQKADVKNLRDQVETIHEDARKNTHAPFTLHITETQLNALLAQGVEKGSKYEIKNLAVQLQPNSLTLQGTADYHGALVSLTLIGNLSLQDSQIQFNAKSLWLGPFPAPSKWRKKTSAFVSTQLNKAVAKDASRLDTLEIKSGELVITGVTQ
ncbi:MAG: hypothetical protein ABI210_15045 [Abditibacteriaceae bacterium]